MMTNPPTLGANSSGRALSDGTLPRVRSAAKRGMLRLGFDVRRIHAPEWADFTDQQRALCAEVQLYTQTSRERIVTLADAVEYIVRRDIPGDFVECGVWLGGSSMVIAKTLLRLGCRDRRIWLYDTFGAMPQPEGDGDRDVNRDFAGQLPPKLTSDVPHGTYLPNV